MSIENRSGNSNWRHLKIGWLFEDISSGTTPSSTNEDYYKNGEVPWVNTGDLTDGKLFSVNKKISRKAIAEYPTLKVHPKNSLIVALYGATIGKLAITQFDVTTNQACCVLNKPRDIDIGFVFYWFLANRERIIQRSVGGGQKNISQGIIRSLRIDVPNLSLQNKIISFLDKKTSEIDALIADKEKLIELLKEKQQAIITESVTKGLNPDVRMKDSDVGWIGEIPEHWDKTKIKFTTYVKGRIGWQGLRSDEFIDQGPHLVTGTDFEEGRINWNSCHHISEDRYKEAKPIQLQENDLLITKDGTIGKVALAKNKPYKAILNSGIFVTRSFGDEYINEYMYWILLSRIFKNYIEYMGTGSTIKHLYQETFVNFSYPLPSIQEQKEINSFLQKYTSDLNFSIKKLHTQISKLKDYRQSLIYEAVTGKIDVEEMMKETEQEEVSTS